MTTLLTKPTKTILVCLLLLCSIHSSRLLAEYDPDEHGHIATYFRRAFESNPALMQQFHGELLTNFNTMVGKWESMDCTILSSSLHEMDVNQCLELHLVRFGEDDFNFLVIQFEKQEDGRKVFGIQSLHVLDPLCKILEPYYHLLPNVEADDQLVEGLLQAMRESIVERNFVPMERYEQKLSSMDAEPPLVATFCLNHHTDQEFYPEFIVPKGEPRILSSRAVTDDIHFITVFQPTSLIPSIWVFTILNNDGRWHVLGRRIVAGADLILPYLSRIEK